MSTIAKISCCFFCLLTISSLLKAQTPKIVLPIGHTGLLQSAVFTPDGNRVITTALDYTTKVWDVASGLLLADLPDAYNLFSQSPPAFSIDGKQLLTASSSGNTSKIWDLSTGHLIKELVGHTNLITKAVYSADGKKILTTSFDKSAKIWDAHTGELLFDLRGHSSFLYNGCFSNNSRKAVTGGGDDSIARVWDVNTGKLLAGLNGQDGSFQFLVFSADDSKIFSTSVLGSSIFMWDANTGKLIKELKGHEKNINSLVISPDGKELASASSDNTVITWNAFSGKLIRVFKGHNKAVNSIAFSNDSKMILTASGDETAKIWDINNGVLYKDFIGHGSDIEFACFNNDGTKIITAGTGSFALVWDVASGKMASVLTGHTSYVTSAAFSPDGKRLVTASIDGGVNIWDDQCYTINTRINTRYGAKNISFSHDGSKFISASYYDGTFSVWDGFTGNNILTIKAHRKSVNTAIFSPDDKKILTASDDTSAKVWDAETGRLLFELKGFINSVESASFSKDGKKIVTTEYVSTKIWNAETGELTKKIARFTDNVNTADFSPNGLMLVTGTANGKVQVWGASSGDLYDDLSINNNPVGSVIFLSDGSHILFTSGNTIYIKEFLSGKTVVKCSGHQSTITSVTFTPDSNYLFSTSADQTCKLWNAKTGQLLNTLIAVDDLDYMSMTPEGYYSCSPPAAKLLHYVASNLDMITFEQLDLKYNRPDKILERTQSPDTILMNAYRMAYYKRIKKNNIDTLLFANGYNVPKMEIMNKKNISYEQKQRELKVRFHASDENAFLSRFNVWVNEVPLFGQKGINIFPAQRKQVDTTIIIKLSDGENKIEGSVVNVNGAESYRKPLYIKYLPPAIKKERLYFTGIGIDNFSNTKYNLQYSVKDIRDMCTRLKEKFNSNISIDTLFNENVTISNVKALKQKLLQTNENDKVIVSYSGHGLLSKDFDYYLSTYAINFERPGENGLPYEELEDLLDSIPARKKLLLIDACHSGEVDKDELETINETADSMKLKKGIKPVAYKKDEKHLGLKNSFELMQNLFVNVSKSTGATVISAAAGTQFALERNDLQNGVFTYSILEAMQKYPTIKLSELKKIVGERVEELTNGLQKPTSRNETIETDWNVW